jgi:hypothetical protein
MIDFDTGFIRDRQQAAVQADVSIREGVGVHQVSLRYAGCFIDKCDLVLPDRTVHGHLSDVGINAAHACVLAKFEYRVVGEKFSKPASGMHFLYVHSTDRDNKAEKPTGRASGHRVIPR